MQPDYDRQARRRWMRSVRFRNEAYRSFQAGDAISFTVLADAVSAIKDCLQGFLLHQVALRGHGRHTHPWLDAVRSGKMPDLIQACSAAGLDLTDIRGGITEANELRNSRAHDGPNRRIDRLQAGAAVDVANELFAAVAQALPGVETGLPTRPTPKLATPAGAAGDRGSQSLGGNPELAPAPDETGEIEGTPGVGVRRGSFIRTLVAIAAAVFLIFVGSAFGVGATVASVGQAPTWFPIISRGTPGSAVTPSASATATPLPQNTLFSAGAMLVGVPVCQAGHVTVQLHNTGATPLQFSAGSPDAPSATFALAPGAPGQPTIASSIPPGTEITLYVVAGPPSGGYRIDVLAPGGTVQLTVSAC